ncbi:glycosyltransferase family 1 protein [Xanthobacter sp. KR7-65]|uniref:glycosyltransferase family 4 protein n=1 Tax=Xanthobacter sp. KR7-65 TaxID=3156612 RepID=UPI0032B44BEE
MRKVVAVDARMALSSGIGVYTREILVSLAKSRPDWTFRLMGCPDGIATFQGLRNLEYRAVTSKIYSIGEQAELPWALDRDVSALWVPHYNIPVFAKVPLVVTVHDLAHLADATAAGGLHRRIYARVLMEMIRRKASTILFVSKFSRAEFLRLIGRPSCPVDVTLNAVAPIWKEALSESAAERPPGKRYLIYVGNVKPHKNLKGLLAAMVRIAPEHDVNLVIAGKRDGFLRGDSEIEHQAAALGDRVQFLGAVADTQLTHWVRHAEALVLPSFYEGFGLPPLEAMAVSCPTVVSDIQPIREVCGEASEYISPHDSADIARGIARVLSNSEYAEQLRAKGRERVLLYDFSKTSEVVGAALERSMGRAFNG